MNMFRTIQIKKITEKYSSVVLYGAGYFAKKMYEQMQNADICVDYVVVTSKNADEKYFEGLPIYFLDEKLTELQKKTAVVFIAVSEQYEAEIEENLKSKNIGNYVLASEILWKSNIETYMQQTEEDFLENTVEWYVEHNDGDYNQIASTLQEWKQRLISKETKHNEVVLLAMYPMPRFFKIVKALKEKNWKITIIQCPGMCDLNGNVESSKEYCDQFYVCDCLEEVMYRLIFSTAKVAHIFSLWEESAITYALIKAKKYLPKLVYEAPDIFAGMIIPTNERWLETEKYNLEHADGVSCRGFELEYVKNYLKYDIKRDIIFWDYCNDEVIYTVPKNNGELSLCYVGGFYLDDESQGLSKKLLLELGKRCKAEKCHFHVYSRDWKPIEYRDLIEAECDNEFFHFHKPIPYKDLSKTIAQYDYMISPARRAGLHMPITSDCTENKYIYCTANKFFDALDAGIPIIGIGPYKLLKMFEADGTVLMRAIEDYDFDEFRAKKEQLRQNVIKAHAKYRMKDNIQKLIDFYDSL